ncbi:MAG: restriction endonuclease subunit S [Pseudomonadota bacterium]
MSGATTGKIGYYDYESTAYLNQRVGKFIPNIELLNNRYLYHFLLSKVEEIYASAGGGAQPNLSSNTLMTKFKIPIPPLAIQEEIVKILDTFTTLEAELEARKKQYEYYREELLTFGDDIRLIELKEIVDFSQGIQIDPSNQLPEKQDGFVRFLRIVDFVKDDEPQRYIKDPGVRYVKNDGDLVMIRYGASAAGKVFLKYSGAIANNMFQIKLKTKELDTKFLYCYLSQPKIYNFLNSSGGSSTMPAITFGQIGSVKIPLPSLTEQERIVSILDKFDSLANDISIGLPAELNARRKQYEYYRNKLLNFKSL